MARKQKLILSDSVYGGPTLVERRKCKYIWGIDDPVSWWNYCVYDDVLLIQYLLNRSCCLTTWLVQDGIFGKKTHAAIKKFQRESYYCLVDGKIDTYKGKTMSTMSNTIYTILMLNSAVLENHPKFFKDISADPYCPTELTWLADDSAVS